MLFNKQAPFRFELIFGMIDYVSELCFCHSDSFYDMDTAANAANKKSRSEISSPPDFLDINEPASILLNRVLVAGVSCGDDLHGVKPESAPTLSARVKSKGAD